jgi:hypothetical protein
MKALEDTIGYGVLLDPEWQLLWNELGSFFPDKENFVVIIAGVVKTWCQSVLELIDDEQNAKWSDILVTHLAARREIKLFLEVSASGASVRWSEERSAFMISLPKRAITSSTEFFPIFRSGLISCFEDEKPSQTKEATTNDDWTDVDCADSKPESEKPMRPTTGSPATGPPRADNFPDLLSLPRPDELLSRPPYHLIVWGYDGQKVEVQSSHSMSLKLIADYLRRSCRVNHNDTRKVSFHSQIPGTILMIDSCTCN